MPGSGDFGRSDDANLVMSPDSLWLPFEVDLQRIPSSGIVCRSPSVSTRCFFGSLIEPAISGDGIDYLSSTS